MDASPSTYFQSALPSTGGVALVTSVQDTGDNEHFRWTFNKAVTGVTSMTAMVINGDAPTHDLSFTGNTATAGYPNPIDFDSPWVVDIGTPGITFTGGAICTPGQSGNTA